MATGNGNMYANGHEQWTPAKYERVESNRQTKLRRVPRSVDDSPFGRCVVRVRLVLCPRFPSGGHAAVSFPHESSMMTKKWPKSRQRRRRKRGETSRFEPKEIRLLRPSK